MGYYLGETLKIVGWDDEAIRRNAKDPRATRYGLIIWLGSILLILLGPRLPWLGVHMPKSNPIVLPIGLFGGLAFGVAGMAGIATIQVGLCHLIAKWFLGSEGRFVEVMRPLLLGWAVNCLLLMPTGGAMLAAIGWTIVLMMVFEEVDGITRLQAFCICAGINFCVFAIQFEMLPVTHHL